ncbi:hypothetical protein [Psychrobacter sp. FDAARGOS_221]|uniref:hypothetical protein n=1 Tax=Psychrobacter sp. FDAARGOS_221 TaxID=1975705 RepID=UPI000BB5321E|nr:hypothetical protein [Psychrobacter sp. FDAARGOS_221]PNK60789.1 hypothetical protein A6J60_007800 [Psychrobacter sp. FDAARGOS_221]
MGVSIYWTAERDTKLTENEQSQINTIISKYNNEFEYADEAETFTPYEYDTDEPTEIFSGSVKISAFDDVHAILHSIDYWLACLSEIRHVIDNASWHVHLDDSDAVWDGERWLMSE